MRHADEITAVLARLTERVNHAGKVSPSRVASCTTLLAEARRLAARDSFAAVTEGDRTIARNRRVVVIVTMPRGTPSTGWTEGAGAAIANAAFSAEVDGVNATDGAASYTVFEFWEGKFLGIRTRSIELSLPPESSRSLAIRKVTGLPQRIGTDTHLLQGFREVNAIAWDAHGACFPEGTAALRACVGMPTFSSLEVSCRASIFSSFQTQRI